MILYHGSNMVFEKPLLGKCNPHKDFGLGFYLSDSFDVARRTALRAVRQRGGEPVVLVFEVADKEMRKLVYKQFRQPGNRAWAKFVLANRNPDMTVSDHNRDRLMIGLSDQLPMMDWPSCSKCLNVDIIRWARFCEGCDSKRS